MLGTLVKKDLRLSRIIFVGGALIIVVPYLFGIMIMRSTGTWSDPTLATSMGILLVTSGYFSILCSQPTIAVLSGNLIASERGDRSAEFLAYLPPARWQILTSKAIVLLLACIAIWSINLIVMQIGVAVSGDRELALRFVENVPSMYQVALIGYCAAGFGWLASAQLSGGGSAAVCAIAGPLVLFALLQSTSLSLELPSAEHFAKVYDWIAAIVGTINFAAGTAYYLRRYEP